MVLLGDLSQQDFSRTIVSEHIDRLTQRERQVMDLVLIGHHNREIGDELSISPRTVETHRNRVMAKMECKTLQDLVKVAVRAGRA